MCGTWILPGSFTLVLSRDRTTVPAVHGPSASVFDVFPNDLPTEEGILALVRPGASPDQDMIISRVRFESRRPWPEGANGKGGSLQLIDAAQGGERIGNWGAIERQWQPFKVTTRFTGTRLQFWLDGIADLLIDDVSLVAGDIMGAGENLLRNGDFETPSSTNAVASWTLGGNAPATSSLNTLWSHAGSNSLRLSFGAAGSASANVYQDLPAAATNGVCTLSFWYLPSFTANTLSVRVGNGSVGGYKTNLAARAILATPGRSNSFAQPLPPFPPIWLNEVESSNEQGISDGSGARGPWVELYNAGAGALDLSGFTLADGDLALNSWTFPVGASINAGEYKVVFVDGRPERSSAQAWHASFALSKESGSVLLSRPLSSSVQILDYLNYEGLKVDQVYGAYPDGQPFDRALLAGPTPAAPNLPPDQPRRLAINEWMSDNVSFRLNGATGKFDDWFEIYNPENVGVTLSGLYLSASRSAAQGYLVPPGFLIEPHGFLMVWCDKGAGTGNAPGVELHTNFKLPKSGGTIGIYAANGAIIDEVTYDAQAPNSADGRCPDGGSVIARLAVGSPNSGNECSEVPLPPIVTPLPTSLVRQGQTLALQILASDPNVPPQPLRFSLGPGAPIDAAIDSKTGVLTWAVPIGAMLGGQSIDIVVATSANPPATTLASVFIDIVPSLRWNGVTVGQNGLLQLSFATLPGKTYRVEFRDELNQGPWVQMSGDITATSLSFTLPVPPNEARQRFYRVTQLN
ncbi:MAG: lamin tail domain-containing protein [Verrucomicrobia bacterium]|nr:lamin tail domain-containing protein [Verrucomicrobiota bacterium]